MANDRSDDVPRNETIRARVGYYRRGGVTAREYYCGACFARLSPDPSASEDRCVECGAVSVLPGR